MSDYIQFPHSKRPPFTVTQPTEKNEEPNWVYSKIFDERIKESQGQVRSINSIHATMSTNETSRQISEIFSDTFEIKLKKYAKKTSINPILRKLKKIWAYLTLMDIKWKQNMHDIALQTQEHIPKRGTRAIRQIPLFLKALEAYSGPNFDQLKKELSDLHLQLRTYRGKKQMENWIKDQIRRIDSMTPGDSIWIDAAKTKHQMWMRLTKNKDNSFTVHFSNTGCGINKNHPKEIEDGKQLFQTVLYIPNVSYEKLKNPKFWETFAGTHVYEEEIKSGGELDTEKLTKIDQTYQSLRQLGNPEKLPLKEHKSFWSRGQLGSSCSPSSIWALSKTILKPEELKILKTDMRLKALLANYKMIKNGWDNSKTVRILVIDQVQKLKRTFKKLTGATPEVLEEIEREQLAKLKIRRLESPIRCYDKITMVKIDDNTIKIPMYHTVFSFDKSTVPMAIAKLVCKDTISFKCHKTDNRVQGNTFADRCYLLYLSIATGQLDKIPTYLQDVLEMATSLDINKQEVDSEVLKKTALLLSLLAKNIREFDKMRSSIAKQLFLHTLAHCIYPDHKRIEKSKNRSKIHFDTMNVLLYVGDDNIWINALKKISEIYNL